MTPEEFEKGKKEYYSEDICENCHQVLADEDFNTVYESRGECHGTPCSECVTTGYVCPNCGHKEEY